MSAKVFVSAVLGALLFGAAHAAPILVTSPALLGQNDTIDWTSQLGPAHTVVNSPANVTSVGGLNATVTSDGGGPVLERLDETPPAGGGWNGNFAPGTELLWDQGIGPDITITFSQPVFGAGAQIQADFFGNFTAEITVYDTLGNVLGTFTENGTSNANEDGSAIFIGALDTTADIGKIRFDLTAAFAFPNDFAIGPLALNDRVVPEPATLGLMGLALAGLGWSRRRKSA